MGQATTTGAVVSGPLLASLLFEQWAAEGDMEALLLGQVQTNVTEVLSDADVPVRQTHTRYRVHSFKVLPAPFSFYTPFGAVDYPAVERLLGDDLPRVIGWVRFRRNTLLAPYARETTVHEDLCRRLGRPCMLWIASGSLATPEGATHDLDYIALAPAPAQSDAPWTCARIPIDVLNLVESTQAAYSDFVPTAAPLALGTPGRIGASDRLLGAFSRISIDGVLRQMEGAQSELQALVVERLGALAAAQQKLVQVQATVHELELRRRAKEQAAAAQLAAADAAAASAAAGPVVLVDLGPLADTLPPPPPYLGETQPDMELDVARLPVFEVGSDAAGPASAAPVNGAAPATASLEI